MTAPAASLTWADLPTATRVEVVRLAGRGEAHPDPAVRRAAHEWATMPSWSSRANRLPGWTLPAAAAVLGVLLVVVGLAVAAPWPMIVVLVAAAVVALVLGLLGANARSSAAAVRAVADRP